MMRSKFSRNLAFLVIVSLLAWIGCAVFAPTDRLTTFSPEPVSFEPAEPQSWTLSNGLKVLFVADDEIPMLRGTLYIRGGALWTDQFVAVDAMGTQMRRGGAGALNSDQLDRKLEILAASIESSFGGEFGTVGFSCLSEDIEEVMALFADVILRPRFEEQQLKLWQGQVVEGISRRKDNPDTIAEIAFRQLLYRGTPYGRVSTAEKVKAVSRNDLLRLHRELLYPDRSILAVAGQVSRQELELMIETLFGKWPSSPNPLAPPPGLKQEPAGGIFFIEAPFSQSTVLMGQLGVARTTPDYVTIEVFNRIFGTGGFGARLFQRVRTDLGLAYQVYGLISPGLVRGQNYIGLKTKSESVGEAINQAVLTLYGLQEELLPENELEEKKRAAENSFVFRLASSDAQVQRKAQLQTFGFPDDYDRVYLSKIKAVNSLDIKRVAGRYWESDKFVVVIVGDDKAKVSLLNSLADGAWRLPFREMKEVNFQERLIFD